MDELPVNNEKFKKEPSLSPVQPMDLDVPSSLSEKLAIHDATLHNCNVLQGSSKIITDNSQSITSTNKQLNKTRNNVPVNDIKTTPVLLQPSGCVIQPQNNIIYGNIKTVWPQQQQQPQPIKQHQIGSQVRNNLSYRNESLILKRNKNVPEKTGNRYVALQSMGQIQVPNEQMKQVINLIYLYISFVNHSL